MRRLRLAGLMTAWAMLWAVAIGTGLVATPLLDVQRLRPVTLAQWALLDAVLLASFALVGLLLSVPATLLVAVWTLTRRRPVASAGWFAALVTPPALALAYVGIGMAFVRTVFGSRIAWRLYVPTLAGLTAVLLVLVPSLAYAYRMRTRRPLVPVERRAAWVVALLALAGVLVLPLRVGPGLAQASHPVRAARAAPAAATARPLLFVGIDSGNWATLEPLVASGRAPTFARLIATGVRGRMHALWPPYWSSPAWAGMLTGYGPDQTGILQDRVAHATGLPTFQVSLEIDPLLIPVYGVELALLNQGVIDVEPPPRDMLGRTPVWEQLEARGVKTAVIRFDFTYPADNQASVVVSNRVGGDAWDLLDARHVRVPGLVWPPSEAPALLRPYFPVQRDPDPAEWAALKPPGPRRMPRDAMVDPQHAMHLAYDIDRESFDSAEQIIASHRDLSVVALYVGGFDVVCHAFWQYRFPEQYPGAEPDKTDIARLGGEIDRYLEFLDAHLARLMARMGDAADVVIVSDHGHEATATRPMWRGWHGPEGIFLAAGPSFLHQDRPIDVSYFEIAPTLLALQDVAVPASMPGRPLAGLSLASRGAAGTSSQPARGVALPGASEP